MKPWISEEIVKTWTEAQKRLWDSLCSAVPFPPPTGVESWRETYLNNLVTWESAVKKTLAQEVDWVEHWVHQVAEERGAPEMMTPWVRQMEDVLQRWIQMQNQWWEDYFAVLRRSGFAGAGPVEEGSGSSARPVATPAAPAATEPEPVVMTETPIEAVSATMAEVPAATVEAAPVAEPLVEVVAVAAETPVEAAPVAEPLVEVAAVAAETLVEAAPVIEPLVEVVAVAAETPIEAAPVADTAAQADDLKLIAGIGPALEKKLLACGIASFRQLASLTDADIDQLEVRIRSFGRIRRDDWIGQAKARHFEKYQEQL